MTKLKLPKYSHEFEYPNSMGSITHSINISIRDIYDLLLENNIITEDYYFYEAVFDDDRDNNDPDEYLTFKWDREPTPEDVAKLDLLKQQELEQARKVRIQRLKEEAMMLGFEVAVKS